MKSKTLVLTNISSSVRKSEISNTFEKYGKIVSLKMKPVETYQATIVFENQSEAEEAHDKSNMIELKGQNVYVNYKKDSSPSRSSSSSSRSRKRSRSRKGSHSRKRSHSRRRSNSRNRNIECYNCHKKGHISRNCPQGRKDDMRGKCFKCGSTAHKMRDCRKSRDRKRKYSSSRSRSSSNSRARSDSRSERNGRKGSFNYRD